MQEMTSAPATITASKALDRHRQVRKGGDQIAFIGPRESPRSAHRAGLREHIDVPVDRFAASHMTGNATSQPTRPFSGAAVQISTGRKHGALAPNPRHDRLTQIDQENVSAANPGDVLSTRPEFCCFEGFHAAMRAGLLCISNTMVAVAAL